MDELKRLRTTKREGPAADSSSPPEAVAATGEQERSPPPPRWRPLHQSRRPPTSIAHIVDPRRAGSCPSPRATPTHIRGRCRECKYCLRGKFLHFRHQAFAAGAPTAGVIQDHPSLALAGGRHRLHSRV